MEFVARMVKLTIEHEKDMAEISARRADTECGCQEIKARLGDFGICVDDNGKEVDSSPTREERVEAATDPKTGVVDLGKFKGTMH